ncbi:MAG: response regulator [Lachnospiraceae bacterium]|nr:response regulator [Lachnospiraceae bacterium]
MTEAEIKILICDDSILARKSLRENLRSFGCNNIIEVSDGQEAIDMYKAERPDITFLDIVMPVKDGITAVKEICDFHKGAYVVMVSSVGTQTHLKEAIRSGAQDFMQKPATPEQIKTIIEHALGGN